MDVWSESSAHDAQTMWIVAIFAARIAAGDRQLPSAVVGSRSDLDTDDKGLTTDWRPTRRYDRDYFVESNRPLRRGRRHTGLVPDRVLRRIAVL